LHDSANGIVTHLDQEVHVIWHQAVCVEIEREFGFLLLENADEPEVIIVGPEYLSAIVAASDDVIEPSADFNPWSTRHGGADASAGTDQMSRKSSLTPPGAVLALWRWRLSQRNC
jgi:hypothetical protein